MGLVINPHDEVSLRGVINVPAGGIGKGVMDAIEKMGPASEIDEAMPLLSIGLQPALSPNSMWSKLVRGLDDRQFTGRAAASLATFRALILKLPHPPLHHPPSIPIGKPPHHDANLPSLR